MARFYAFVGREDALVRKDVRRAFEDVHAKVADFEPNEALRLKTLGLIDEAKLRDHARTLLRLLEEERSQ